MAGADMILSKIMDDARTDASATITEARERAQQLKARSQETIETARRTSMEGARRDAEQNRERRMRMALLDARKEELSMKREVIDEAFALALGRLLDMQEADRRKLFAQMLVSSAQGGETILPSQGDQALFTQEYVAELNAQLSGEGKAPVTLGNATSAIRGGFILELSGMECNCSIEALLRQERDTLETEVARALFPAKEG